jgi:hypothetical protein
LSLGFSVAIICLATPRISSPTLTTCIYCRVCPHTAREPCLGCPFSPHFLDHQPTTYHLPHQVPAECVGPLLGKGANRILKIESLSGCLIDMPATRIPGSEHPLELRVSAACPMQLLDVLESIRLAVPERELAVNADPVSTAWLGVVPPPVPFQTVEDIMQDGGSMWTTHDTTHSKSSGGGNSNGIRSTRNSIQNNPKSSQINLQGGVSPVRHQQHLGRGGRVRGHRGDHQNNHFMYPIYPGQMRSHHHQMMPPSSVQSHVLPYAMIPLMPPTVQRQPRRPVPQGYITDGTFIPSAGINGGYYMRVPSFYCLPGPLFSEGRVGFEGCGSERVISHEPFSLLGSTHHLLP